MSVQAVLKKRLVATVLALSSVGAVGIVAHEGMKRVAYVDPVGIVTVCAGHTRTAQLGQVKTEAECAELLKQDVKDAEAAVKRLVKTPLTQAQFDSLVSLVFNIGQSNFAKSTMLKKINANDCWGAGKEFDKWVLAKGQVLPGLVKRRADERKNFETGCAHEKYITVAPPTFPFDASYIKAGFGARRPEHSPAHVLA